MAYKPTESLAAQVAALRSAPRGQSYAGGLAQGLREMRANQLGRKYDEQTAENERIKGIETQRLVQALSGAQIPMKPGMSQNYQTPEINALVAKLAAEKNLGMADAEARSRFPGGSMGNTPITLQNAEGQYGLGRMTPQGLDMLQLPEGYNYVPDSGRMGFDPTAIARQGEARTGAEVQNIAEAGPARIGEAGATTAAQEAARNAAELQAIQEQAQPRAAAAQLASEATTAGASGGLNLTPAQRAVDNAFAPAYADFVAGGGYSTVSTNLQKLGTVLDALDKSDSLTGGVIGNIPRMVREIVNPASVEAQEAVEGVVQQNLRLVLGAQFTEREGDRLIARAYNPRLDEATNRKRLSALITQIAQMAQAKAEAARYYEENGTLQGYQGRMPSIADLDAALDRADAPQGNSGWRIVP